MNKKISISILIFLFVVLLITSIYAAPTAPSITTNQPTDVGTLTATLNATIADDGNENCSIWFEFGKTTSYGNESYAMGTIHQIVRDEGDNVSDSSRGFIGDSLGIGPNPDTPISSSIEFTPIFGGYNQVKINKIMVHTAGPTHVGDTYTASVDVYINIGESDTVYGEGTKVISDWKPDWKDGWQEVTFNASNSYVLTNNTTYEIEFITNNIDDDGNSDSLKLYTDTSATSVKFCQVVGYNEYGDISFLYDSEGNTGDIFEFNIQSFLPFAFAYGVESGMEYHYRAVINNTNSTVYGSDVMFHTCPPDNVTNQTWSLASGTLDLTLNWTKGNYSDYTLIRRDADDYPDSITDGTLVYNNTGNGTVDTGLDQAYLYTFWAYNSSWNCYSDPVYLNWSASWLNEISCNPKRPSRSLINFSCRINTSGLSSLSYEWPFFSIRLYEPFLDWNKKPGLSLLKSSSSIRFIPALSFIMTVFM